MSADQYLANRRVVVTRSAEQALSLCRALERAGAVPIRFPTIQTRAVSIDDGFAHLRDADWLVFTSTNGVRYYLDALDDSSLPASARIAAAGTATASALRQRGVDVAIVPDAFDGRHLAVAFEETDGRRFVLVQPIEAMPDLAEFLESRGGIVTRVVAYRTETASSDARSAAVLAEGVDAVTFTSPSTVRGFVELVDRKTRLTLEHAIVVCIGPVTAGEALRCGIHVDAVADPHTTEGLLAALDRCFEETATTS